jgi:Asp-tRNA(Asn)/Glu-tRNA(Gln) amidotransferase A subunit family amidase
MSRGLKNNNPGNIRISATKYLGEVQPSQDRSFKQFKEMRYGYRAMFVIINRMKAIISQPMEGKTEAQVRAEREAAIKHLNEKGYVVVDTVFPNFTNEGNIPLKYLAKSIEAIADVDLVYFIGNWKDARSCRIEFECCVQYGVEFEFEFEK